MAPLVLFFEDHAQVPIQTDNGMLARLSKDLHPLLRE
jgi:hypothetical protein